MLQQRKNLELSDRLFIGRDRAAELLDVSTRLVDDAIRNGELGAFRVGRRVLIRKDVLLEFAERFADQRGRARGNESSDCAESVSPR